MSVAPSFDLMLFYEKTALVCVHTSDCSLGRDGFRSMVLCENHPCSCSSIFLLLQLAHQADQEQADADRTRAIRQEFEHLRDSPQDEECTPGDRFKIEI